MEEPRKKDKKGNTQSFNDLKGCLKWDSKVNISLEVNYDKTGKQTFRAKPSVPTIIPVKNAEKKAKEFVSGNTKTIDCNNLYGNFFKNSAKINWQSKSEQEYADQRLAELLQKAKEALSPK